VRWLWDVVPVVALLVYLATTLRLDREEARRRKEVRRWTDEVLGPVETRKGLKSRRVKALPSVFNPLLEAVGAGERVSDIVLVPKLAYMAVRSSDHLNGSDHTTVLCRLDRAAPHMVVRPLPIVDGNLAENTGLKFRKDPEFMDAFIVEGAVAKKIGRWLTPPLREALMEVPDAWLRTQGKQLALTLYGPVDAELLDELVAAADTLFAEYGEVDDESLFGDGAPAEKMAPPSEKKLVPAQGKARLSAGGIDVALYAVACVLVAAVTGAFDSIHPEVLFTSPARQVEHSWQGGWTTKGVGALVAVQSLLVGLVALQAWLAVARGSSIGSQLVGLRFVQLGGKPRTFLRAVLLRHWLLMTPAVIATAALAPVLSWRALFANIITWTTGLALVGTLAVVAGSVMQSKNGRGIHDHIAGTRAVQCAPWAGFTPAEKNRALVILGLVAAWIAFEFAGGQFGFDVWH